MSDPGLPVREKLFQWLLDVLGRSPDSWNRSQRAFIESLLKGEEGTKTVAQLAVATANLRASGLAPQAMGPLLPVREAMEAFWNNPSARTYQELHAVGKSLDSES